MEAYGESAGIDDEQAYSLVHGRAADTCWTASDRPVLEFVDELHNEGRVSDRTWEAMAGLYTSETLLELLVLVGWYHAISYLANGTRVELESWATLFPAKRA